MTYVKENYTNKVTIYNQNDDVIIRYSFSNSVRNVPSIELCTKVLKDLVKDDAEKNRKD